MTDPSGHDPYCFASRGHYKCECTLIRMVIDRERKRLRDVLLPILEREAGE